MKASCVHAKKRPVNLDLTTLVFPPMAIASILHRISGVVLFLLFPYMLYLLDLSLRDVSGFTETQILFANPYHKILLWAFLSSAWYHVIAGVRHMVMDCGFLESLEEGRLTAIVVILLGVVGILGLGVWIW